MIVSGCNRLRVRSERDDSRGPPIFLFFRSFHTVTDRCHDPSGARAVT
jgi:hypothetical protein